MEITDKELRYALLQANQYDIAKAKRCYDFVQSDEPARNCPCQAVDGEGIYLIYADGHSEQYTGANDKGGVTYIGVAFDGRRFAVALVENKTRLLKDDDSVAERDSYKDRECDALYDFNSFGNTKRLVADNSSLAALLKPGEAIPALGELVIMCRKRQQINEALAYVGGDLLTDNRYWSSIEHSVSHAWYVDLSSGCVYHTGKFGSYALRAVAAF